MKLRMLLSIFVPGMIVNNSACAFHIVTPVHRTPFGRLNIECCSKHMARRSSNRFGLKALEDNAEENSNFEMTSGEEEQAPTIPSAEAALTSSSNAAAASMQAQSSSTTNIPMANNPLVQGEVTMDGSLIVLIPAAVIAIGGLILSVFIGINSSDEIVQTLNASIEAIEIKPRNEQSVDSSKCRGLCSSQQEDLQGLQNFMQGLAGKKVETVAPFSDESTILKETTINFSE